MILERAAINFFKLVILNVIKAGIIIIKRIINIKKMNGKELMK